MTDLKNDDVNEKTIQLIDLAVRMANSIAADVQETEQYVSQETADIVSDFIELYEELNRDLDEQGVLQ